MGKSTVTVVVGDKFSEFASLEGVTTVSRLANLFDGLTPVQEAPTVVMFGQGVSESWRSYLTNRTEERGFPTEFIGFQHITERTGRKFCHKWNRHNVLITDPKPTKPHQYEMLLSIDDACEIMSDHVSGYHVQGMIFVEAARQAFLAVTECHLVPKDQKYYFVINKLDIRYHKFAFPLPTEIEFDLDQVNDNHPNRLTAKATIRFYQCGDCVVEAFVDYAAIVEDHLIAKEKKMAIDCLTRTLSSELKLRQEKALMA